LFRFRAWIDRGGMASEGPWKVTFTPEAEGWLRGLAPRDRKRIDKALEGLEQHGPVLGRPRGDSIRGSRYHNMKELRSVGGHLRALYAFDRNRSAIVLVGGDKAANWKRWYKQNIPVADQRYERHLRQRGDEPPWRTRGPRTGDPSRGAGR
jgi:hypothetical protein